MGSWAACASRLGEEAAWAASEAGRREEAGWATEKGRRRGDGGPRKQENGLPIYDFEK